RSPWPVDETRTLAIAWEMWSSGGALVPQLNGEPAPQYPPMLFWLIQLGWSVLGVNAWWPRVVPALFGLASLFLVGKLARALWPDQTNVGRYAPLILIGMVFWSFYLTLSLGDMLFVFFTLLGMFGIVTAWRHRRHQGWLLLGLSLGLGVLAAGIGIFLYVGPAAVLLPFWAGGANKPRWSRWYADVFKACLLAAAIAAVFMFALMSEAGASHIDRLLSVPLPAVAVDFFGSLRPWWWYVAVLLVVTLPWSIFPLVWMRLWHIRREKTDPGIAFCLFWAWPTILILSVLSVKQPQFLLPVLPAFALGMTYLLLAEEVRHYADDSVFSSMAFPIIVLGGLLAAVPGLPRVEALPEILWETRTIFIGIAIAAVGVLLAWLPPAEVRQRITNIAAGGVALLVMALVAIGSQFDKLYGTQGVASYLARAQQQQREIAHVGPYDGQFQFAGRLAAPLEVIGASDANQWSAEHPGGLVVTYTEGWQPPAAARSKPAFEAPYRDQRVRVWDAHTILAVGS
ncbi:MAG: ArnT family glycosyltransferase, partial [Acidiferrobacterales bacterium]